PRPWGRRSRSWQQQPSRRSPWGRPSQQRASSQQPACRQQSSKRSPWGRPFRQRASSLRQPSKRRASSRQRPWGQRPSREPSSRSSPCRRQPSEPWPSSRPASSRQPLVNLLDLHEVSNRAHVPAVRRGVLAHDDIADALEAQAAQGVALVLLLADNGLDLGHLETRSEEHTSELQSRENLVCRLLLEKKKLNT